MSKIEKTSHMSASTLRCIYSERWEIAEAHNPLHDWVLNVLHTGGQCSTPDGLPPLVCSETNLRQTATGLRGSVWLLFSEAKTPHKKDAAHRLTARHITIELEYGTKQAELRFDFGPDWREAISRVQSLEEFAAVCQPLDFEPKTYLFPAVTRSSSNDNSTPLDEAA